MANLPETPVWETGIYQLEETDPVQGGPNGIDNQQGKQLANRTAWLKSQVETLGTGKQPLDATLTAIAELNGVADRIAYFTGPDTVALTPLTAFIRTLLDDGDASAARSTLGAISKTQLDAAISELVNSSPATLDTLNELAAALGNDANFATTVTNALAAKAPIASPVLTGDPKAPTPAQFDNDTSLATTAFVQRALGNMQGVSQPAANTTLTSADVGKLVSPAASGLTITLPVTSAVSAGSRIEFFAGLPVTVATQGGDTIWPNGSSIGTSITLGVGDSAVFEKQSNGIWLLIAGAAQAKYSAAFGASLASSGYQKLPSGLIIQWGKMIAANGTQTAITLPIAFTTECYSATITDGNASTGYACALEITASLSQIYVAHNAPTSQVVYFIAIGK